MKRRRWSWPPRSSLADHLINYFESANHLPHPIACREGCSFCCFNQVEVTPPEALRIGHYVAQNFSQKDRDGLMKRVNRSLSLKAGKSEKKDRPPPAPIPLSPPDGREVLDLSGQASGLSGHAHL